MKQKNSARQGENLAAENPFSPVSAFSPGNKAYSKKNFPRSRRRPVYYPAGPLPAPFFKSGSERVSTLVEHRPARPFSLPGRK